MRHSGAKPADFGDDLSIAKPGATADNFFGIIGGSAGRILGRILRFLNPKLGRLFNELGENLAETEKWAEEERKSNPDFAQAEKDVEEIMKDK